MYKKGGGRGRNHERTDRENVYKSRIKMSTTKIVMTTAALFGADDRSASTTMTTTIYRRQSRFSTTYYDVRRAVRVLMSPPRPLYSSVPSPRNGKKLVAVKTPPPPATIMHWQRARSRHGRC